jgi:hypothetical protein
VAQGVGPELKPQYGKKRNKAKGALDSLRNRSKIIVKKVIVDWGLAVKNSLLSKFCAKIHIAFLIEKINKLLLRKEKRDKSFTANPRSDV